MNVMNMMNIEGIFPIELWRQFVELAPKLYGRISRLSRRHYGALRGELDYFKSAACELQVRGGNHYWTLPNGKKHGKYTCYYKSGIISCEMNYVDGLRHGQQIGYYISGAKAYISDYVNDIQHGRYMDFRENGSIKYEVEYENGKRHGTLTSYTATGAISYVMYYDHNAPIGEPICYTDNVWRH